MKLLILVGSVVMGEHIGYLTLTLFPRAVAEVIIIDMIEG